MSVGSDDWCSQKEKVPNQKVLVFSASANGLYDVCGGSNLADGLQLISVLPIIYFFSFSPRHYKRRYFERIWYWAALTGSEYSPTPSPPSADRKEVAWHVPQYVYIPLCSIYFINAGVYIQLLVMTSFSYFHSSPVSHISFIKVEGLTSSIEAIFFFHSLRVIAMKKNTAQVLFPYKRCMRVALAVRVFAKAFVAGKETAGLRL